MISRLRTAISRQLSRPSGAGGRLIASLMNRGNRGLNDRAIDLLDVPAASRVMERVSRDIFTIRPPTELADALTNAGFDDVEVISAPDGKTHLIAATG